MANALAQEASPYLRQHAENPVDWLPWGEEALARAVREDKPLLVSVGYAACHWCHVMERESFSDPEVAALMNRHFVCVKVDREERPDVDAYCIAAAQAIAGHAGWPLNVFMTPERVPFFAGTYFPPAPRGGLPSWRQVLEAVAAVWRERRGAVRSNQQAVAARLGAAARIAPADALPDRQLLGRAVAEIAHTFDKRNGGFGSAPKFPPAATLLFLLARGERSMTTRTLDAMALGGIYDQLAGGFHRYAVDERWLVPHFEKMLYDNALLARCYTRAWLAWGDAFYRTIACETLDWAIAELGTPEGGFCSSLDADSDGGEGRFYVWTRAELDAALGPAAAAAADWFGVDERGNFEHGSSVLTARSRERPHELSEWRRALLAERARRPRPARDDKRICSWNALMLHALAEAGAAFERSDYLVRARALARFLLGPMRPQGELVRTWKDGRPGVAAFLSDYAHLLEALVALYEATFEARWLDAATDLATALAERFHDRERGGFFETPTDRAGELPVRLKEIEDHPIPSGNASAAAALLRLAELTGEERWRELGDSVLKLLAGIAERAPSALAYLLLALDFRLAPPQQVAIVGDPDRELVRVVRARLRPHVVVACGEPDSMPLLRERPTVDGKPTAYVCENFTCKRPVTTPRELAELLR